MSSPFITKMNKAINIPIGIYIDRWCRYAVDDDKVVIIMLALILRIKNVILVNIETIHRLLATTFLIACKYHYDLPYSNRYYSTIAGLSLKELNSLEEHLLTALNWEVHINQDEFINTLNKKNELIEVIVSLNTNI